ncbi:MAG: phosphatidylglycerol lysyltransferase domain-containing protein [Patescibacteria group bacterium]
MLPEFPKFKSIELSDKEDVEKITHKYPPCSDFNFVSMWSWDIKGEMRISQLYGNLIVRFTDYLTGEPFYSFLGDNKVNETAQALLELSKEEGLKSELKLVPEFIIEKLDNKKFKIKEDRDHFDYIYDLKKLSEYSGPEYYTKRSEISRFLKKINDISIQRLDIFDEKNKYHVFSLNNEWLKHKKTKDPFFNIPNELIAINKFLSIKFDNTYAIGIFEKEKMIAYFFGEIFPNRHAVGHFCKASKYSGLFDFIMKESSRTFLDLNAEFLNFEQDLGVEGLKKSKMSYRPVDFLKKYCVF